MQNTSSNYVRDESDLSLSFCYRRSRNKTVCQPLHKEMGRKISSIIINLNTHPTPLFHIITYIDENVNIDEVMYIYHFLHQMPNNTRGECWCVGVFLVYQTRMMVNLNPWNKTSGCVSPNATKIGNFVVHLTKIKQYTWKLDFCDDLIIVHWWRHEKSVFLKDNSKIRVNFLNDGRKKLVDPLNKRSFRIENIYKSNLLLSGIIQGKIPGKKWQKWPLTS